MIERRGPLNVLLAAWIPVTVRLPGYPVLLKDFERASTGLNRTCREPLARLRVPVNGQEERRWHGSRVTTG
jgi:hypothetical protein